MKKKITIIDKSFTPIVVLADTSSALYEDRCGRLGERNLLSDTEIICKAMDGTKEIASVKAHVLQVPTKKLPLEALHATEQNPIPAKQLAINYLCQKMQRSRRSVSVRRRTALRWFFPLPRICTLKALWWMRRIVNLVSPLQCSISSLAWRLPKPSACSQVTSRLR